ncbi:hypothetical protein ACI2J5_19005 [Agrobacterium pusense]|uniref:hypothetical protein n=1 Tax=Agrobacterium pusense TaxID=648995 RepID=UPI00384DB0BB
MFNLLMSGLTTAFEVSPWELEKARFGEYTDPVLLSQFEKLDEPPVKALLSLPATSRWTSPIIAICSISTTVRASKRFETDLASRFQSIIAARSHLATFFSIP